MARTGINFKPVPRPWIRGSATIEGDRVVLDLDDDTTEVDYPWSDDDELALSLAAIKVPEEIPAFVSRFGLLRNGPEGEPSESVADWLETARGLRTVMTAAQALHRAKDIDRDDYVEAVLWLREVAETIMDEKEIHPDRARQIVARWVAGAVSVRMEKVQLYLTPVNEYVDSDAEPGVFAMAALPEDLVEFAYWQIASTLSSQEELRSCEGCDRFFKPAQDNQRFHDPACSNRTRQRRFAAKGSGRA